MQALQVIALRTALLAWALGVFSALVGSLALLLLAGALCAVSIGALAAAALEAQA